MILFYLFINKQGLADAIVLEMMSLQLPFLFVASPIMLMTAKKKKKKKKSVVGGTNFCKFANH